MLEIKNLKAQIEGKTILNGVNLKVNKGEVHAIMGPNGSGKTTLINLILRFYESNSGSIFIDNINILHTIGGDDTNTMAAQLSFYLEKNGYELTVVGLPKTDIDFI